jgi:hypothetical protein
MLPTTYRQFHNEGFHLVEPWDLNLWPRNLGQGMEIHPIYAYG